MCQKHKQTFSIFIKFAVQSFFTEVEPNMLRASERPMDPKTIGLSEL